MIPSNFGPRVPRGVSRSGKSKSPAGERVVPPTKDPSSKDGAKALKKLGLTPVKPAVKGVVPRPEPNVVTVAPTPKEPKRGATERVGVAVVGRFVPWPYGQHPDEAYLADALERLGIAVYRVNQDLPRPPIKQVEWAIFTGHPSSLARFEIWRSAIPTIIWTLDWLPDFPERAPMIDAARRATMFLSSDQFDWKSLNVFTHGYLPGACEAVHAPYAPKPEIPCAFIGSIYSPRRRRIAEMVRRAGGVVLSQPGSWRYGMALSSWLQTVKVLVGDSARNDVQGYWSTRNYIVPGAGGFLLTPRAPGLDLQFKFDEEIAVYDSVDDLEGKLKYWIESDVRREQVRAAGFARARQEHAWDNRAKSLLVHLAGRIHASS